MKWRVVAHRLVLTTLLFTYALLIIGGLVHPTGSSLACPDWPLCYGQVFPAMQGGVAYEHGHRLLAAWIGLLTLALALILWRLGREEPALRRWGLVALVAVNLQAILGGVTVLLRLPLLVSVGHFAISMLFFVLLIFLALRTRAPKTTNSVNVATSASNRRWASVALVAVYGQLLLGAFTRHTKAGLACGNDVLLCANQLWPHWHLGQIQMVHRVVGLLIIALLFFVSRKLLHAPVLADRREARWALHLAPWLAVVQIAFGLWTVATAVGVLSVSAHLAIGAALLAMTSLVAFELRPARLELSPAPAPLRISHRVGLEVGSTTGR